MINIYFYIIIALIIVYIIKYQTIEKFENIEYLQFPIWNIPTRMPRLFYDIRGDPNIVYRRLMLGGYAPYGYVFGPYIYDSQGNLIHDKNKPYYIA